jgi:hypothetical protein
MVQMRLEVPPQISVSQLKSRANPAVEETHGSGRRDHLPSRTDPDFDPTPQWQRQSHLAIFNNPGPKMVAAQASWRSLPIMTVSDAAQ